MAIGDPMLANIIGAGTDEARREWTFVTDREGCVSAWTLSAARLFGYSADEILGRPLATLVPADRVAEQSATVARALAGHSVEELETEGLRRDGVRLVLMLTVEPQFTERSVTNVRHSVREATPDSEAAALREHLAQLREQVSDAILTVDLARRVTDVNPAAERRYGCPRADAVGRGLGAVIGTERVGLLDGALRAGAPSARHALLRLAGADGTAFLSALPIRARDGTVTGFDVIDRAPADLPAGGSREAWHGLAGSLDLERTLEQTLAAFVPSLADVCLIFSVEDGERLRVRATRAADPEVDALTAEIRNTERPIDPLIERELIAGGGRAVLGRLSAREVRAGVNGPYEADLARRLGPVRRTALALRTRDGVWGLVVLLSRDFSPALDLPLAESLAERAGHALENAQLYASAVEARARFTAAFENAPSGMALVRVDTEGLGIVSEANPALCEIAGCDPGKLTGSQIADLYHPDDREAAKERASWLRDGELERYGGERRFQRADGHTAWVQVHAARLDGGTLPHVVLQVQDISDRKRYEGQLQYLADHDPLTGLYNRRRFAEELDWVLAFARRYGTPAAVLVIDVDNFKFVNDTFGHATGDDLLTTLGETLRSRCRDSDISGRLGGDEFGVILPQCGREEAEIVAAALLDAVREHVRVSSRSREVRATASIGVRLIGPGTKLSADEILSDADIALYDAKESGRDRLSVVDDREGVTDRLRARIGWSDRIRDALLSDGFELFEQPIVTIATGRPMGSELLLRMRDDDGSIILPGHFLDVAERFGQIQAIDCWVIGRAIRILAERQAAGIDLDLQVNLSGGSVTDATVIDFITSEVRNAPIDPTRLIFEITETTAIVNIDRARALAQSLADLGCRLALDDFGSGFGSFYYLKHLPFDVVKIDGEFVREIVASRADRLTVQAVVQIARGLGKPTIAERVENQPTLELLMLLGVEYAQGYHLGKPRPVRLNPGFDVMM